MRFKQLLLVLLFCAFLIDGCKAFRTPMCPIIGCHVRMVHKHSGQSFRGRPWWKRNQNPKIGQDYRPFMVLTQKDRQKKKFEKKKKAEKEKQAKEAAEKAAKTPPAANVAPTNANAPQAPVAEPPKEEPKKKKKKKEEAPTGTTPEPEPPADKK